MTTEPMTTEELAAMQSRVDAYDGPDHYTVTVDGITYDGHWAHDLRRALVEVDRLRAELRNEGQLREAYQLASELALDTNRELRAENTRLAAQDRVSGPETTGGHPSEGMGVPGQQGAVQAADGYPVAELISRTLVLPFGTRHNRGHIREIAARIDNEVRPAHYREAAASLRALGHDTAADLLDSTARDLKEGDTTE